MTWLSSFKKAIALNNGCVLLTVIETKGSTPCSVGDKIVYSNKQLTFGSIGGGNLEFLGFDARSRFIGQRQQFLSFGKISTRSHTWAMLRWLCEGDV